MILVQAEGVGFRLLTNNDDDLVFRCLQDWPPDKNGPFSRKRAGETVHNGLLENAEAQWPLNDKSDFYHNMVLEKNGEPFGFTRCRIWGSHVFVNYIAFLPEFRGAGLFEICYRLYTYLIFEVYQASKLSHTDFTDVHALSKMRQRHQAEESAPDTERYPKETERDTIKYTFTRAHFEATAEPWTMSDGRVLEITGQLPTDTPAAPA